MKQEDKKAAGKKGELFPPLTAADLGLRPSKEKQRITAVSSATPLSRPRNPIKAKGG